jgi:hypothetical protein
MSDKKYYVYLVNMEGTNTCKIGYTNEHKGPEGRLRELQTGCPYKLTVLGSYLSEYGKKIEGILHRQFASKKIDESMNELLGEWFELEDDDINNFEKECKDTESTINFLIEGSTFDDPLKFM